MCILLGAAVLNPANCRKLNDGLLEHSQRWLLQLRLQAPFEISAVVWERRSWRYLSWWRIGENLMGVYETGTFLKSYKSFQ